MPRRITIVNSTLTFNNPSTPSLAAYQLSCFIWVPNEWELLKGEEEWELTVQWEGTKLGVRVVHGLVVMMKGQGGAEVIPWVVEG